MMEVPEENIFVACIVHDKEITISCGSGTQKIKWLGTVAIARYDEESYQVSVWPCHADTPSVQRPLIEAHVVCLDHLPRRVTRC